MRLVAPFATAVLAILAAASSGLAAAPPSGFALAAGLEDAAAAAALLPEPGPDGPRFALRVDVPHGTPAGEVASATRSAAARARLVLRVHVPELSPLESLGSWEESLRGLSASAGPGVAAWEVTFDDGLAEGLSGTSAAFLLKRAVLALRSSAPDAAVALDARNLALRGLFDEDVAPFVDAYLLPRADDASAASLLAEADPGAATWGEGLPLGELTTSLRDLEVLAAGEPARTRAWLAFLGRALPADAARTDVPLTFPPEVTVDAQAWIVASDLSTRVAFRPRGPLPAARMIAHLRGSASDVRLLDPDGAHDGPVKTAREPGGLALELPLADRTLVVAFDAPPEDEEPREDEEVAVAGEAEYSLEEILARHFERQAQRDAAVSTWTADVTTEMRYELGTTGQVVNVRVDGRYFESDDGTREIENRRFFINGAEWKPKAGQAPEIPLMQPEKVTVLPLEISLDRTYRYELAGRTTRDGRPAWKVRFEPLTDETAYAGSVFIDAETWDRLGVDLVQTRLEPPIVSSAQDDRYGAAGADAWLVQRSDIQRLVSVLGSTVAMDIRVAFSNHRVNDPGFAAALAEARASTNQMLRDTDEGLRYLRRTETGERVVVETSSRKIFVLAGARYDPSYGRVLPLGGVNWLDSDVGRQHLQVNLFLAGAINTVSVSDPSLFGSRVSGSVDAFLPVIRQRDRLNVPGLGVDERETVRARQPKVDLEAGIPAGRFGRLRIGGTVEHQSWSDDDETDDDFAPPSDTFIGSVFAQAEIQRRGFDARAWVRRSHRTDWEPWGPRDASGDPTVETEDDFWKWGALVGGNWHLPKFQEVGLEAEYVGGDDLDRFSQHEFAAFGGTRLPGFDGTGIHFDEAALVRFDYGFQIAGLFGVGVQLGWGRTWNDSLPDAVEDAFGDSSDHAGAALTGSLPGPWRTLIRFDVGAPIHSSDHDDVEGDVVAQVLVLKLLK